MSTKIDVEALAANVAARIIANVESGADGWRKPWKDLDLCPRNVVTGAPYAGRNRFILALEGHSLWASYRQWSSAGAQVRKGEKGIQIFRPMVFSRATEDEESAPPRVGFSTATVFNATQVDGWEPSVSSDVPNTVGDGEWGSLVDLWSSHVNIVFGQRGPCFTPILDKVFIPPMADFVSSGDFMASLTHEIVHWTGASQRLDRLQSVDTADGRCREEIIAELGAAIVAERFGWEPSADSSHEKYIAHWVGQLRADPSVVWDVVSAAEEASKMIFGWSA